MNLETAADSWIRPQIQPQATPAHAVAPGAQVADASGAALGVAPPAPPVEEDYSFFDLLDVINPLQHIPVVSSIYREITGDEIKAPARILGGLLFGGPVGFVASAANAIVQESSGRDLGSAVIATLFGSDEEPAPTADLASGPEATTTAVTADSSAAAVNAPPPTATVGASAGGAALTGSDALRALAADLRGGGQAPASGQSMPGQAASAQSVPAQSVPGQSGPAQSGPAQSGPPRSVPGLLAATEAPAPVAAETPTATPTKSPTGAGQAAEAAIAAGSSAEAAYAGGKKTVPANLMGLGTRDRRGLAPVTLRLPHQDALEARLNGPAGRPEQAEADSPAPQAAVRGAQANLISYDPTLFSTSQPAAAAVNGNAPGSLGAAAGQDFSGQMLEALKKYEHMLDNRKAASAS